ncbi:MAG: hypothetical protein OXQ89_06955 [Rhodospirillaceae bacterium]|nr:hypothetical protein [Rhodospirillaceae bacterium]
MVVLVVGTDVGFPALCHLVPVPSNYLMEWIFRRDLPDDAVPTTDGMVFELPRDDEAIYVTAPR